jgi:superfamily II DNA or RNA helicase
MASFSEFLDSIYRDGNNGKQFEQFAKWFLKNDPEWKTQVAEAWLWDEFPERWGRDKGIDLVFKHRNGEYWAVQAKCYDSDYYVTKADIDSFLSESNRKIISRRLLMATTDRLGANAVEVCRGQEKPVTRFMLTDFEHAEVDYPDDYRNLRRVKKKPRPSARDHQKIAIKDVVKGFKKADRGQLIMACGTGKTFTTLWIKEKMKSRNTLVLLPSLNLLAQTVREWSFASGSDLDVFCVCSDKSVGRTNDDDAVQSASDVPFPVHSDILEIRKFMRKAGDKVIFSTYQSSDLVAEAQEGAGLSAFDLVVADEAHRCAISGKSDSPFSIVLDGNRIKADKRLFATATPRTYTARVKKAAEERGVEVVGMDDEVVFGRPFHTLTFGEAIKNDPPLLTDYQVVIVGVDNAMVSQWIEDREIVTPETGDTVTDAGSLAAQIGLLKAMKDYNLKRVISFHSRVKRAEEFSSDIHDAIGIIKKSNRPTGNLKADFVSGKMATSVRGDKLKSLKGIGPGEIGLLSNARCLSEGIDVPALDGVAFVDPKNSQVDIIQAVGRAIRLSGEKDVGTIVLPVFIEDGESPEERIEASNFKPVWWVLDALKSHDDVLVDELDSIRTEMGRRGVASADDATLSKIEIDLPVSVGTAFAGALRTHLVEHTTASWNFWFGLLEDYVSKNGNSQIDRSYKTTNGNKLGFWVSHQRSQRNQMAEDRRRRLEATSNWIWDLFEHRWGQGISHLEQYVTDHGNARVPKNYRSPDGYGLGKWIVVQRSQKDDLSKGQKSQLESFLGWSWDPRSENWRRGFKYLQQYASEHGNTLVPHLFKTVDEFKLGPWVIDQRKRRDQLTKARKQQLESIDGWVWNVIEDRWDVGFGHLCQYVTDNGDAIVPGDYTTSDGYKLGIWVSNTRRNKDKLSEDRIGRIEALKEWTWDVVAQNWEEGFVHLKRFAEKHQNALVPQRYGTDGGFQLGKWVSRQRAKKDSLSVDQIARLEKIDGWSWDPLNEAWEIGFNYLKRYVSENGDTLVPSDLRTSDGFLLGSWVRNQRTRKQFITKDRKQLLEALPGWAWNVLEYQWEMGFQQLQKYVSEYGNTTVSRSYKTEDGNRPGLWISTQRRDRNRLSDSQRTRLESLAGWSWDPLGDRWEANFQHLRNYVMEHGNPLVPRSYKTIDGTKLGHWVSDQRVKQNKLPKRQRIRLERLQGWRWRIQ